MKLIPSLHLMTEYSLLQSSIKIDDLISFAISHELKELVLTDHNNMFGVAEFIHKCKKNKIKPIIGLDLDVEDFRLILISKNYNGFLELIKLSSMKNYGNKIQIKDINEQYLFVIDHPEFGYYKKNDSNFCLNNLFTTHDSKIASHVEVFYTRFLRKEDSESIKIIDSLNSENVSNTVIGSNYKIIDSSFSTYDQIKKIIDACNIDFPININPIPKFDKNEDSKLLFRKIINTNAPLILGEKFSKYEYIKRLNDEIQVIEKLKFQDYFLIIYDLIHWSKKNKILIGPGRGSAPGSLISYIFNITEVDPIEHGLLFERFLNIERVTMPDIDIDIQDNQREELILYLIKKYNAKNVGLISTFQRLTAKSSLREVGRMMKIPIRDVLAITKFIPQNLNLNEAFMQSFRFKAIVNNNEKNIELFNNAKKVEGLPKNLGTHAAGVVISNNPLNSFVPIIKSSEGYTQIQYSMDYLEENGMLKIDLLGLRNLTILKDIQNEILKNYNRSIALTKIPFKDAKTNKILSSGKTDGIFQLESYGMKKTLMQVKISSLNDLADVISLFRPGPIEFIELYSNVKNGIKKQKNIDIEYDKIVKSTYGIIIYQEQIMQIAQKYANMTFSRADILRRAISKKNKFLIDSIRKEFVEGSIKNNHTRDEALNIFKLIEKFANYGFNKSHAISYAILAYRMAYLKAWFPFEFYTSLIKSVINSPISLKQYIDESKQTQIIIVAPKINIVKEKVFNKKPYIYLPLSIIKGLGSIVNSKIIAEREVNGKYNDFFDFVVRCRKNGISESIILSIIKSNALSEWDNITSLIDSLPQAIRYASMVTQIVDGKRVVDFNILNKPKLTSINSNLSSEIQYEKEVIGFNISLFKSIPYEEKTKIKDIILSKKATIVARIIGNKEIKDKNNNIMGIFFLEDSSMKINAFAFKDVYKLIQNIKKDQIVKVSLLYKNSGFIIEKNWEIINEK